MNALKAWVLGAALAMAAGQALAQDVYDDAAQGAPSAEAMAFDLLLVRPVSLVGTVLGCGVWLAALPLSLLMTGINGEFPTEPGEQLVAKPFAYTFDRPLGQID